MVEEAEINSDEEQVEKSRMPLVAHLTELRKRLLFSLMAFLVLFFICFYFAGTFFNFLVEPLAEVWEGQDGRQLIYTALTEKFFTEIKVAFFPCIYVSRNGSSLPTRNISTPMISYYYFG